MTPLLCRSFLAFGVSLLGCLLLAQQPPAKPNPPPAKPGVPAPDKNAPAKPASPAKTNPAPQAPPELLVTYTFDGVRIEGDYYPAPEAKAKSTPVLILLHPVGNKHLSASRADFGKLPEKLQKMGYAVAAIDLRGYGKSKSVESKFWNTHRPKSRSLDTIDAKDYATALELLEMMYDLTAVKIWLNTKNNAKECNSQILGIIAVEQSGLIALAWSANENTDLQRAKQRPAMAGNNPPMNTGGIGNLPFGNAGLGNIGNNNNQGFSNTNPNQGGNLNNFVPRFEGEDIATIVMLSTSNRLNDPVNLAILERWISFLRIRQVAMMAIYGANDKEAAAFWNRASNWIKPTNDKYSFKNSGTKPIKGTSLVGIKLLTNDTLDVTRTLEEYLKEALRARMESKLWSEQTGPDRPTPIDIQRLIR